MDPETLNQVFEAQPVSLGDGSPAEPPPRPRYNIAPTTDNPVVRLRSLPGSGAAGTDADEQAAAVRTVEYMHWGLVPSWAKDPAVGNRMFNARSESVTEKPAFRTALGRRRCLVPASGYYEWQTQPGSVLANGKAAKPSKQPYYITPEDGSIMAFAGLWEYWKPRSEASDRPGGDPVPILSYTILTTNSVGELSAVHERMPLIIPAPEWAAWLDPALPKEEVLQLLRPPPLELIEQLDLWPVDPRVGNVRNNDPDLTRRRSAE